MSERSSVDLSYVRRRKMALAFWRIANPLARPFAGLVPWWVLLETSGRRSGQPRRVPLARGPVDGRVVWLISVHGEHATFVRNIQAQARVRLKLNGKWHSGSASIREMDQTLVQRFNLYARLGPRSVGIEPRLVRIELDA